MMQCFGEVPPCNPERLSVANAALIVGECGTIYNIEIATATMSVEA